LGWRWHARSPASTSGSSTCTATPTPSSCCCRCPASARSSPARSADASATLTGSPAWQPPRAFSGLIPRQNSSGLTDTAGGPTKQGDACLRQALFLAADHARKIDPTLAARYQRLMCEAGRHHTSALCTIATVLLTRIVACLRNHTPYQLRDVDGQPITPAQGRAIIAERYQIPPEIRAARRAVSNARSRQRGWDERTKQGVAERSTMPPVPQPA